MIQRPQQDSPHSPAAKESGERGVSLLTPLRYSSSPSFLIGGDEEEGIFRVPRFKEASTNKTLAGQRHSRAFSRDALFQKQVTKFSPMSHSHHRLSQRALAEKWGTSAMTISRLAKRGCDFDASDNDVARWLYTRCMKKPKAMYAAIYALSDIKPPPRIVWRNGQWVQEDR